MAETIFTKRLTEAMNAQGMKQVEVIRAAEKASVKLSKGQMSQYVSGRAVPRDNIGSFLAELLKVDKDWLYGKNSSKNELLKNELTNKQIDEQKNNTIIKRTDYNNNNLTTKTEEPKKIVLPSEMNARTERNQTMREFKKSSKLDNVLYDVRGPVVEEANRMEETGVHVLKLNIGNPAPFGFRTPDEVIYDMQRQLTECEGYSAAKGLFAARKAIMQYSQLKKLPNVSIEDIYTGNGVSELINLSMSALLDNGDEVLIPSPDYPL